jgi:hypothetical protein
MTGQLGSSGRREAVPAAAGPGAAVEVPMGASTGALMSVTMEAPAAVQVAASV